MKQKSKQELKYFLLVVATIFVWRVIPHPPNLTPVLALALWGSVLIKSPSRLIAALVAGMFLSDLIVGAHELMPFIYGCYALIAILGLKYLKHESIQSVGIYTFTASTLFFALSNFAVFLTSGIYPRTLTGLVSCYTMALPFYGVALLGDLLFSAAIYLVYNLGHQQLAAQA
ncbi:hypothetical protein JNK13_09105 [bacterium]|nr:hypothetical protein [bacterium]